MGVGFRVLGLGVVMPSNLQSVINIWIDMDMYGYIRNNNNESSSECDLILILFRVWGLGLRENVLSS
jgi:hypothetical protein